MDSLIDKALAATSNRCLETCTVSVKLPLTMRTNLETWARLSGVPFSRLIRQILSQFCPYGDENDAIKVPVSSADGSIRMNIYVQDDPMDERDRKWGDDSETHRKKHEAERELKEAKVRRRNILRDPNQVRFVVDDAKPSVSQPLENSGRRSPLPKGLESLGSTQFHGIQPQQQTLYDEDGDPIPPDDDCLYFKRPDEYTQRDISSSDW
jgi:hypothetical protein